MRVGAGPGGGIRHPFCSPSFAPSQVRSGTRWLAMVVSAHMRTVNDWTDEGYRGLRIPRCTSCRTMTWRTWDQLQAKGAEEVLAVAQRFHCGKCDQVPAGLPVIVGTGR